MTGRDWLIALTRLDPGESDDHILARLADHDGYADVAPELRELARLRDEIAICDSVIADLDARVDVLQHCADDEGEPLDELGRAIDETRVALVLALPHPSDATPPARRLRELLRARIDREPRGLAELAHGARMRDAQSTPAAREAGRLAAFWIDV